MPKTEWSAAVARCDLTRLAEQVSALEAGGCRELHVDIADGAFVPAFALGDETIAAIASASGLPIAAHLMVERPERHIARLAALGCANVTVHLETLLHAHRTLQEIQEAGLSAGIAINPATPLTKLQYLLPHVDRVLVLARDIEPEPRGEVPGAAFERVRILRENLSYTENRAALQVQGPLDARSAAQMIEHGATAIVIDTAEAFGAEDLAAGLREFIEDVEAFRNVA